MFLFQVVDRMDELIYLGAAFPDKLTNIFRCDKEIVGHYPNVDDFFVLNIRMQRNIVEHHDSERAIISRFILERHEDINQISGTGIVADGALFQAGVRQAAFLRWRTTAAGICWFDGTQSILEEHGHQGKTVIRFIKQTNARLNANQTSDKASGIGNGGCETNRDISHSN
jgi:hypothetical protein